MIELYIFDIIIAALLVYLLAVTVPLRVMFFKFNDKRDMEQDQANKRWTLQVADLQAREMNVKSMIGDCLNTIIQNGQSMYHYISDGFNLVKQQMINSECGVRSHIEWNYDRTYEQFDCCRKKLDGIEAKLERDKRRRGRRTERRTTGYSGRYFRRLAM